MIRTPISESHTRALAGVLKALRPGYRVRLRWAAQLYHARFGVPALLGRPRPSLNVAHQAAGAFLSARRAGIDLETFLLPPEALHCLVERLLGRGPEEPLDDESLHEHPPTL